MKTQDRREGEAKVLSFLNERVEVEREDFAALRNRRTTLAMARERVFRFDPNRFRRSCENGS